MNSQTSRPTPPLTPGVPVDRSRNLRTRGRNTRLLGFASMLALPFVQSRWPVEGVLHESLEMTGLALLVACILGRIWCSAYIGGRKNYELVTIGPFSVVRNPLYVFNFVGFTGIGLLTGMATVTLAIQLLFVLYYRVVVAREEEALAAAYGAPYRAYLARVPRWLPDPRLWIEPGAIEVRPRFLYLTARDVAWIILLYPLIELIDHLQMSGSLPVLLHLP